MGIWSKVILLAAWALIAFVGDWPDWVDVTSAVLVVGVVAYLSFRERAGFSIEFVRGNLLYLFPGHALLLFGLSLSPQPPLTGWWAWAAINAGTVAFDVVAHGALSFTARKRLGMVLYAWVWGGVFVLVHQVVAAGGKLDAAGMAAFTAALGALGLAYVGLALYRLGKLQPLKS